MSAGSVRCLDGAANSAAGSGGAPPRPAGTQSAVITGRRALELPGPRGGLPVVMAGADRLHRTLRRVYAGEVPNTSPRCSRAVSCC